MASYGPLANVGKTCSETLSSFSAFPYDVVGRTKDPVSIFHSSRWQR
jgi:hypothetical protein